MLARLIGSTGLTGSFLVQKLLADSQITRVISVSRRSLKIAHPKLTEVLVYDVAELPAIGSNVRGELYFCCLGTIIRAAGREENFRKFDHDAVAGFANIAEAHDAKSFTLVSAMGRECEIEVLLQPGQGPD
jgi:uncharacterized protein YbjT (DUF2867 family)